MSEVTVTFRMAMLRAEKVHSHRNTQLILDRSGYEQDIFDSLSTICPDRDGPIPARNYIEEASLVAPDPGH